MRTARAWIPIIGLVTAASACTGGDQATPSTSAPVTTILPIVTATLPTPPDVIEQYFQELSSPTGDAGVAAVRLADADRYAEHLRLSRLLIDAPVIAPVVTVTGGVVEVCQGSECVVYDQIVTDPASGRVVTFSIDGVPLAGRLSSGGLPTDADGVIGRTITAYRSNAGQMLIIAEISNTTDVAIEVFGFAAVFRAAAAASGAEAVSVWGESAIQAGAVSSMLFVFDSDGPEGRMQVNGLRDDGIEFELDINVPVPG
jgi:hypothetical protein